MTNTSLTLLERSQLSIMLLFALYPFINRFSVPIVNSKVMQVLLLLLLFVYAMPLTIPFGYVTCLSDDIEPDPLPMDVKTLHKEMSSLISHQHHSV